MLLPNGQRLNVRQKWDDGAVQAVVLAFHIRTLPFHSHGFNLLRAGIFAAVLWAAVSSAVVSSASGGGSVTAQWALIAMTPICFFAGMGLAQWTKLSLLANARRLRADYTREGLGVRRPSLAAGGAAGQALSKKRRGDLSDFFDADATTHRAFDSAPAAHATIRILLYEKDQRGPPPRETRKRRPRTVASLCCRVSLPPPRFESITALNCGDPPGRHYPPKRPTRAPCGGGGRYPLHRVPLRPGPRRVSRLAGPCRPGLAPPRRLWPRLRPAPRVPPSPPLPSSNSPRRSRPRSPPPRIGRTQRHR